MPEEAASGSPEVIDVESLLQPIPGDNPAGTDIRTDVSPTSLYYRIKDARAAARATERAALVDGPETGGQVPPEWATVLETGPAILREHAKDLDVAAWTIEALVRRHGFPGLRDGFRLAKGLVERFWDGLYPLPDEEGVATRVASLSGLNGEEAEGTLIAPIIQVPVTGGASAGPFATWQYQQALEVQRITDPESLQRRLDGGATTMEVFEKAVHGTPPEFFRTLKADLEAAMEAYAALGVLLDEKCGSAAPPAGAIRSALQSCLDGIVYFARGALEEAVEEGGEEAGEDGIPTAGAAGGGRGGPPVTRDQAFRSLEEVATFFRRTEPHSPLSFSLEQAVRWGRLDLPSLLKELIPDPTARDMYFKLTGIRAPEGDGTGT